MLGLSWPELGAQEGSEAVGVGGQPPPPSLSLIAAAYGFRKQVMFVFALGEINSLPIWTFNFGVFGGEGHNAQCWRCCNAMEGLWRNCAFCLIELMCASGI